MPSVGPEKQLPGPAEGILLTARMGRAGIERLCKISRRILEKAHLDHYYYNGYNNS